MKINEDLMLLRMVEKVIVNMTERTASGIWKGPD